MITAPALSEFASRADGPVWPGPLFPFLFVTIACGALSGFHALIASGTTPKLIEKERQTRLIGYGGMLMESFVAIMALVAALSHRPWHLLRHELLGRGDRRDTGDRRRVRQRPRADRGQPDPGDAHLDGSGGRRGVDHLPDRRRPHPRPRSGAHHAAADRRRAHLVLVPLRDHVRGTVHPHRRRRGNPGRPGSSCRSRWATSSRSSATPRGGSGPGCARR